MGMWFEWAMLLLVLVICIFMIVLLVLCFRLFTLLDAKTINEKRAHVLATGAEAYAFAESIDPEAGKSEKFEQAIDYMRRQFELRGVPFDYEHARAVIEQAASRFSHKQPS